MRGRPVPSVLVAAPFSGILAVCLIYAAVGEGRSPEISMLSVLFDVPHPHDDQACAEAAVLHVTPPALVLDSGCGARVRLARAGNGLLVDRRLDAALRIARGRMRPGRRLRLDVADGVRHGEVVAAIDAAYGARRVFVEIGGTYPGEDLAPLEW